MNKANALAHKAWLATAVLVLALLVQACAAPAAPAASAGEAGAAATPVAGEAAAAGGAVKNALGKELPADAAPLEQQVLVYPYSGWRSTTTVDFFEAVYQRGDALTDLLSDSLVRLDKDFKPNPGAATEWSSDDTGTVWTFKLDPKLMWNDGTPVTADDYVATFQYGADPKHAWDFNWYYSGVIKNFKEAVAGTVPVDQIGVRAVDANTLEFTTETPAPYLPAMLVYSTPLQKKALEAHGGLYNSDPATSVSSGPYKLVEWTKDQRIVYEINPDYKGTNIPYIQKLIVPAIGAASQMLPAYQANEIDFVRAENLSPADLQIIEGDQDLAAQVHPHYGDFRTFYFFFDTSKPPFDDLKVRQAFAYALDRDSIIKNIVKRAGIPAYSYLMPGFPDSNSDAFKETYAYNIDKAKQLLSEAGFPDGKDFPKLVLNTRGETPINQSIAQAYAANLKEKLGVDVEVQDIDSKTYMAKLQARPSEIQFGLISYGMDYLDASNMLGVFRSGGRHTWSNPEFDKLVAEASSFTGDPAQRTKMFQDAEKILVDDVGGIFVYHQTPPDIYKPYLKGPALEPDKNGVAAWHWPGFSSFSDLLSGVYISKDVTDLRPTPPQ